jgi:hypothetical protein
MSRRIRERVDDVQLLDDRAELPVRDDERQGISVFGFHVDELNVDTVDLGREHG